MYRRILVWKKKTYFVIIKKLKVLSWKASDKSLIKENNDWHKSLSVSGSDGSLAECKVSKLRFHKGRQILVFWLSLVALGKASWLCSRHSHILLLRILLLLEVHQSPWSCWKSQYLNFVWKLLKNKYYAQVFPSLSEKWK